MVVPMLDVEEYQFGDTGVLLNGDSVLPFTDIVSVQGLDSAPVRFATTDQEGRDGGYADSQWETMRTVTIEGTLYAPVDAFEEYVDSLKANYAPSTDSSPLYFATDAGMRCVFAKSQGFKYNKDQGRRLGKADFQIQLTCEDPRIYSATSVNIAQVSSPDSRVVTLSGNRTTPTVIRLTGPLTNPVITVNDNVFSFTYTLGVGHYIDIDLLLHTVTLDNSSTLRDKMSITAGSWFMFEPGHNELKMQAAAGTGQLETTIRSAWR